VLENPSKKAVQADRLPLPKLIEALHQTLVRPLHPTPHTWDTQAAFPEPGSRAAWYLRDYRVYPVLEGVSVRVELLWVARGRLKQCKAEDPDIPSDLWPCDADASVLDHAVLQHLQSVLELGRGNLGERHFRRSRHEAGSPYDLQRGQRERGGAPRFLWSVTCFARHRQLISLVRQV